ncbi:ultraviolet-B receptor UVR8-like [Telopea speciosissima]|uniref:ultraviolet-B receptor UVR8-like n=1 Tax=Telopea speciosissima TaxID=54955 RepID=UPI001CC3AF7D|nr:ultraviolet-B receptor UVR8-like [Telopea speciosissima]
MFLLAGIIRGLFQIQENFLLVEMVHLGSWGMEIISHIALLLKSYFFCSKHVEQVTCGMRHSLLFLKGDSEHPVYGFGSGKRGQLGFSKDRIRTCSLPQAIFGFEDVKIVNISANGDHSAALSVDGQLYT